MNDQAAIVGRGIQVIVVSSEEALLSRAVPSAAAAVYEVRGSYSGLSSGVAVVQQWSSSGVVVV